MLKYTWIRKTCIILFGLAVWQAVSLMIGNSIILTGPIAVLRSLLSQLMEGTFWKTILYSFGRITIGFLLSFLLGILLGSLAYRFPLLKEVLEPVVSLMKSIPVASFIILALIWIGSKNLAVLVAFLIVFPILYINTTAGLESTDPKLMEMAQVFRFPLYQRVRYIYRPALIPYLVSACRVTIGMSWKSGIAAEVIGVPTSSIGEQLYLSKIYLNTADLLAWTIVIIAVSVAFEKLFLSLLKRLG